MKHLGDYDAAATLYSKFTTYRPSTGAAFTLGGSPAVSVYKDGSATQSTAGVALTPDFDSVAGLNHLAIDTSADGAFYSAGSNFDAVITSGTVDGVSVVGSVVASFTIRKEAALKPTTAGRTLDVSAGGEAGLDWANIGSPTTAQNLSGTNIDVDQVVASVSGAVASVTVVNGLAANVITAAATAADFTTEVTAGLATAAALTTVGGNVSSIKTVTDALPNAGALTTIQADLDNLQTRVPAALVSGRMDVSVGAMAADVLTAAATAADFTTEVTAGLATSAALATVQADTDNIQTRLPAALVGGRMDADVGAMQANVMTAAAAAADLTTELQTGLATSAVLATVAGNVTSIKASTDNLPSDPADQSLIIAATNAIVTLVEDVPTVAEFNARTLAAASYATSAALTTVAGYVDTEVGAIKTVTDKLDTALELDGAVYRFTTNALEQAPSGGGGGGPTAAQIADEVQTRTIAAVTVVNGLAANAITAAATAADFTTEVTAGLATAAALTTVAGNVTSIKAKTDALPADPADASDIMAATDAIVTLVSDVPTVAEFTARTLAAAAYATAADLTAVKAKTDALPADPADQSLLMAAIAAVQGATAEEIADEVLRSELTEDYAGVGDQFTLQQGLYMLWSIMSQRKVEGDVLTAGALDNSAAMTFLLDDTVAPTEQHRNS